MSFLTDLQAKVAQYIVDADRIRAWVKGPAAGAGSTVDFGDGLVVKTIANLVAAVDTAVQFGVAGPVAWLPPVPWATALVCVIGPPATAVTYLNELYVCTTAHTAGGAFDAAKFIKVVSTDGALLSAQGDLLTRDATVLKRLARGSFGQFLGINGSDLAWQSPALFPGVRQCATAGPVTSGGLPDFLPATTTASLDLPTQNVGAGAPFCVAAANGNSAASGHALDRVGVAVANFSWTALADNARSYLYIVVNADGTLSRGHTVLPRVVQWGGVPSTVAGQFTFNVGEMKGYLGNGSTAPQAYIVFVGEALAASGSVTETVAYGYNGLYDSGGNATLPGTTTTTTRNHNLGVPGAFIAADFAIECTTADLGYAIGDTFHLGQGPFATDGTGRIAHTLKVSTKTASLILPGTSAWNMLNTSNVTAALTLASWKWRITARRRF